MQRIRGTPDFLLLMLTFILVGFGIVMVFSASSIESIWNHDDRWYFARKQVIWACLGLILMFVTMNIPYTFYKKAYLLIGLGSLAFMLTVFIPGIGAGRINGAWSWISVGGFTMQPAEFAKLGLIIYLSAVISKKGERIRDFSHGLFPVLTVIGLFCGVIILQNDFGTAAILLLTALVVVFCGGARVKHFILLGLVVLPFILLYILAEEYRLKRVTSFLNPWEDRTGSGYHLIQSLFAIAHGRFTGVGLGQSIQKYLYLPYPQTDFIFSVMAEELGMIGVFTFLLFYLALLWRALLISLKSKDTFASLAGIGVVSMIAIQALINIGGVTGSIPITGVPLPLISYGGSSLLVNMTGMGIILGISREVNRLQIQTQKKQAAAV